MPGLPRDTIFERITRSCETVMTDNAYVQVDQEAVNRLATSVDRSSVERACAPTRMPIQFENLDDEINLLAAQHILDFGSGWDGELQARCGRSARDAVLFGLIGMHITGVRLDARGMKSFSQHEILSSFGIDSHEAAESGIPGVTMSRPGALAALTGAWKRALNETGDALDSCGCSSMGEFLLDWVTNKTSGGSTATAAALVEELVETFPAFDDKALIDGNTVYFYRKAQNFVCDLHLRLAPQHAAFDFPDMASLTADSGAAVIAALRGADVLCVRDDVARSIDDGVELEAGAAERSLRAAAIMAVAAVAAALPGGVHAWQLSRYLSNQTSESQPPSAVWHRTKATTAY